MEEERKNKIKIFNFDQSVEKPVYVSQKTANNNYLSWGKDNMYPSMLLNLFNYDGSPLSKSIILKKAKLISGFGLEDFTSPILQNLSRKNKLNKLVKYLTLDMEIFNGFSFEIIFSNSGKSFELNYIPLHSLRIGLKSDPEDEDFVWFSRDWSQIRKEEFKPKYIPLYNPSKREGRQIFYYHQHNPENTINNIYPVCSYSNALNYISLDGEISKFHLNSVRQGFSPSFLLNIATGLPTAEEADEFYSDFKKNYASTGNSGKVVIMYSEGKEQAPELTKIDLNDSDQRFLLLQDTIEKNIAQSHETPVALVSSIPEKLGSSSERKEILAEFDTYYVKPRQEEIEDVFNGLFYDQFGIEDEFKLKSYTDVQENNILTDQPINQPNLN